MRFFQSEFLKHEIKVYINKCNVIPQQLLKTMTATFVLTISIFFYEQNINISHSKYWWYYNTFSQVLE